MFGGMNLTKLKTNLRLAINRLKLIGKKKTELTQKSRKEIADFIANGKEDRARIKVEQIIREDYYVEAFELLEMFCDLLLARFGLIEQMKTIDKGLEEAINSILWAAPRLQTEIPELKVISDQLTQKYGKPYAEACRDNRFEKVNEKLLHKLSVLTPPKVLVEKYMVEIAKSHNVNFIPDANVVMSEEAANAEALLIDYQNKPGSIGGGGGGLGFQQHQEPTAPPPLGFENVEHRATMNFAGPNTGVQPFNYPNINRNPTPTDYETGPNQAAAGPLPEKSGELSNATTNTPNLGGASRPPPPPYSALAGLETGFGATMPTPPSDSLTDFIDGAGGSSNQPPKPNQPQPKKPDENDDDFDFDDLNRRFEELKKKR